MNSVDASELHRIVTLKLLHFAFVYVLVTLLRDKVGDTLTSAYFVLKHLMFLPNDIFVLAFWR